MCTVPYNEPLAVMLMVVNYGVHAFMYPYFALKVSEFNFNLNISKLFITITLYVLNLKVVNHAIIFNNVTDGWI